MPSRSPASTPQQVYEVAGKLMAQVLPIPGLRHRLLRLLQQHAQPRYRHPPRPGQDLRHFRDADPHPAAQRLLAELPLPDQEARRPVPGDPGSAGPGPPQAGRPVAACISSRDDGKQPRAAVGALVDMEDDAGPAGRQPHEPVHQRDVLLQPLAGRRHRRRHRLHRERGQGDGAVHASAARLQGEALTFRDTVAI